MRTSKKRRQHGGGEVPILVQLGEIPADRLEACGRALARLAVENALRKLGLDNGPTIEDNGGQPNKKGPAGAENTDEAKERVL